MRNEHNFYDELEIIPTASQEVIEAAYRILAQKFHPDRGTGNNDFPDRMARINAAYRVLRSPILRHEYDETLRAPTHGSPRSSGPSVGKQTRINDGTRWQDYFGILVVGAFVCAAVIVDELAVTGVGRIWWLLPAWILAAGCAKWSSMLAHRRKTTGVCIHENVLAATFAVGWVAIPMSIGALEIYLGEPGQYVVEAQLIGYLGFPFAGALIASRSLLRNRDLSLKGALGCIAVIGLPIATASILKGAHPRGIFDDASGGSLALSNNLGVLVTIFGVSAVLGLVGFVLGWIAAKLLGGNLAEALGAAPFRACGVLLGGSVFSALAVGIWTISGLLAKTALINAG